MHLRFARVCCALLPLILSGPAVRAEMSARLRANLNATLPAFRPNPPEPKAEAPAVGEPHDDDDVVKLPRFYVEDSKLGRTDPDVLLTRKAREEKALNRYLAGMNPLELLLNAWHIPYLTPSAKARANAAYDSQKNAAEAKRLSEIANFPRQ